MGLLLWVMEVLSNNLKVLSQNISSGYLTSGIGAFGGAYNVCRNIASNVCQPIAYTFLTIFLLLDFLAVAMQLTQQGGSGMAAPVAAMKTFFKLAFVKWAIDNSSALLGAIFDLAVSITSQIGGTTAITIADLTPRMEQLIRDGDYSIIEGIGAFALLFATVIVTWIAIIGLSYVILSRYVQLYFYIALSPIPMSFFAQQHTIQMGVGYFKGFAGVALQSAVIALALKLFPSFASAVAISDNDLGSCCLHIAMLSIILLGTVMGSSQVAQRVFGS